MNGGGVILWSSLSLRTLTERRADHWKLED